MWQRQRLLFKLVSRGYAAKSPSSSSSASSLTSAASSSKLPQSASSGLAAVWKKQAPNRDGPWSESQVQRQEAMTGPRFEQTDLSAQPSPLSAMELIAEQPVINVQGRIATCDGGKFLFRTQVAK